MNIFLINHTVYCDNVLTTVHAYSNIFHNGRISSDTIRTRKSVNNWIREKFRTF